MTKTHDSNKKYYETPEFFRLQRVWAGKLKQSGFEDIEYFDSRDGGGGVSDRFLRSPSHVIARRFDDLTVAYYDLAADFYRAVKDRLTIREREIWELHLEGFPIRATSRTLRRRHPRTEGYSATSVKETLQYLRKAMGRWAGKRKVPGRWIGTQRRALMLELGNEPSDDFDFPEEDQEVDE